MSNKDYKGIYSIGMNNLVWDSNEYDVHHIDLNHDNNDFDNLVLVPKRLHRKFHFFYTGIKNDSFENLYDLYSQSHYTLKMLSDFFLTKDEMQKMLDLKNQLLIYRPAEREDFDLILSAYNQELYSKYIGRK